MKRHGRKWLFACLGLGGILLLGLAVERIRGKAALENRLSMLRSQGEKLMISDWEPEMPRPEENAAVALFALTNQLDSTSSPIAVPSRRVSSPGFAIVGHRVREWYPDKESTNRWVDVAERLKDQAMVMESIKKALDRPKYHTGFDYKKGFQFEVPTLSALPRFMRDLNLETLYELHQTNMNAAYDSLLRTIHFAAIQGPEALIIFQLVRQPLASFACSSTWEALETGRLTDEQLRGLQAAWNRFDFIGDMTRGIEMERAMELEVRAQMRQSKSAMDTFVARCDKANEIGEHTLGLFPPHGAVRSCIQLPLWRIVWCYEDSLISLNNWQSLLERHRKATQDSWASLENPSTMSDSTWFAQLISPSPDGSLSWFTRFRYPFSSIPSGISEVITRRTLMAQTQQQMTLAALAIQRYRLATGSVPQTLSALVPKYLSTVPHDHMGGGELRYKAESARSYLLYSVGLNGQDDGGDASPLSPDTLLLTLHEGKDFVWPKAASREEAEAFLLNNRF